MASNNAGKSVLSRRYAKALFDSAIEKKTLKDVEKDVASLGALIHASEDLVKLFASPVTSKEQAETVLNVLFKKMKLSKITQNFCFVMNNNRRLAILADVITSFEEIAAEARGEVSIDVTSASKLSKDALKQISSACAKVTGKKIKVNQEIDESILGGVIVKIGSQMIDGSVIGKLDRLKLHLKNADAA